MESIVHMSVTERLLYYAAQNNFVDIFVLVQLESLHTYMCTRQVNVHEHCSQTVRNRFALVYTTSIYQFPFLASFMRYHSCIFYSGIFIAHSNIIFSRYLRLDV